MGINARYEFDEFEQRIWDLMDEDLTTFEIIDRLDAPPEETMAAICRIVKHRGTPRLERIDRTLERMRAIRVY